MQQPLTADELELAAVHAEGWPVGEDGENWYVGQDSGDIPAGAWT